MTAAPQGPAPGVEALEREIARLERLQARASRVLVADDMQTMRLLLAQALRGAGFEQIFRAPDGDTALEMIREQECDLALVDWNMPRMDGLELLTALRDDPELNDIVFIMVTAENLDHRVVLAAEEKMDAYLTKPVSPARLDRRLAAVLERRLVTARALRLEALGRAQEAQDQYMAVIQGRPKIRWPYFGLGSLMARQGQDDEAARCYRQVLEIDPTAGAAVVELARLAEKQGQPGEARRMYQQVVDDNPMYMGAFDALAEHLAANGDPAEAAGVLEKAVGTYGGFSPARHERLGDLRYESGRYLEAEDSYQHSARLNKGAASPELSLRLAAARLGQDRHEEAALALAEAADAARRAGQARPRAEALMMLAETYLHAGMPEEAAEVFEELGNPQLWPGERLPYEARRLHREVGLSYLRQGFDEEASRHIGLSLMLSGQDPANREAVRMACQAAGRPDVLRRAVGRARDQKTRLSEIESFTKRGLELAAQGKHHEALGEHLRAQELDPGAGRVRFNIGRLMVRWGRPAEAMAELERAGRMGLARRDWELTAELARTYTALGRLNEAKTLLTEALNEAPGQPLLTAAWDEMERQTPGGRGGEPEVDIPVQR